MSVKFIYYLCEIDVIELSFLHVKISIYFIYFYSFFLILFFNSYSHHPLKKLEYKKSCSRKDKDYFVLKNN